MAVSFEDLNYEDLRRELGTLPATWYPDLIRAMVEGAHLHNVFKPGGVVVFVDNVEKRMEKHEQIAEQLYDEYCKTVGGKAWDGKPLPDWRTFRNDPVKLVQVQGWINVARKAQEICSVQA